MRGVETRHQAHCPTHQGGRCRCQPAYRASVWDPWQRRKIRRTFRTLQEALEWRRETERRATKRRHHPAPLTVTELAHMWIEACARGAATRKGGRRYKPATVTSYARLLDQRILPHIGHLDATTLDRTDLQRLIDALARQGLAPNTVRAAVTAIKALWRWAAQRDLADPRAVQHLETPASTPSDRRALDPETARRMIQLLPDSDQPIWATALWCGLRVGELMALEAGSVDLQARQLRVEATWDRTTRQRVPPKAGVPRTVPIPRELHPLLAHHLVRTGRRHTDLVFGTTPNRPFSDRALHERAHKVWAQHGLPAARVHDMRHAYGSWLIAAGANIKTVQQLLGHRSIQTTLDVYGHLLAGAERDAVDRLERWAASRR